MVLNWSSFKKRRFMILVFLVCVVIIVHLKVPLIYLLECTELNDLKTLMSLKEVHNKVIKFDAVPVKEIGNHVSNNSRELHTVEDR